MNVTLRKLAIPVFCLLVGTAISGCVSPITGDAATPPRVREIRMWVEPMDWEIHPGVTTPVWAFCAEGDGVEPAHDGPCGVPGPTIRVQKGDLVRLTLENTHSIPHSVHFHGFHDFMGDMNGHHLIDGMSVAGGENLTIEWKAEPAGSFIYHCHFQTVSHMEMGMYGTFIVEDPDEAVKPDREFVAVIDEWAIGDDVAWHGNMPGYDYFTINGKSFPLTAPMIANPGERVRIHMVNAGYEFHAMHVHGYTPMSWEGVAGSKYAVPTDVREIAPGQAVVLEFTADREGVWLFHDHIVPRVTAGGNGNGFGTYPRGMLSVLVVGDAYEEALARIAPQLLADAKKDVSDPDAAHAGHDHGGAGGARDPHGEEDDSDRRVIDMKNVVFAETEVRVKAGTTVEWVNRDGFGHTVTADDGSFDSGDIPAGANWSRTFAEPGTYRYHCAPHAYQDKNTGEWKGMIGTVIVEE